ncbi:MAG: hypothetical protein ACPLXC_02045 [Candidatus Pacearchaeota archaeon]
MVVVESYCKKSIKMVIEIYINLTKYPRSKKIVVTPILYSKGIYRSKRYKPIVFDYGKEGIDKLKKILDNYFKRYTVNFVLSEKQLEFISKRDTKGNTLEALIELLENQ